MFAYLRDVLAEKADGRSLTGQEYLDLVDAAMLDGGLTKEEYDWLRSHRW